MYRLASLALILFFLTDCKKGSDSVPMKNELYDLVQSLALEYEASDYEVRSSFTLQPKGKVHELEIIFKDCQRIPFEDSVLEKYQQQALFKILEGIQHADSLPNKLKISFYNQLGLLGWYKSSSSTSWDRSVMMEWYKHLHSDLYQLEAKLSKMFQSGNYNRAYEFCDSLLKNGVQCELAYQCLGKVYHLDGDTALAKNTFRYAVKEDPENVINYQNLAIISGEMGDYKDAMEYIQTAFQLDSSDPKTLHYRGLFRSKTGDSLGACEDFYRAKMGGFSPNAFYILHCDQDTLL